MYFQSHAKQDFGLKDSILERMHLRPTHSWADEVSIGTIWVGCFQFFFKWAIREKNFNPPKVQSKRILKENVY